MIIASSAIYFSASKFRRDDFHNRLRNKGRSTARLLFEADRIEPERVLDIEKENPVNLYNEKIIIINFLDDILYSTDEKSEIKISPEILERVRLGQRVSFRQDPYEVVGTLYLAKLDRFVVIAAATDLDGLKYLEKLKIILLIVCFISIIAFFIAGWLYSGRALKPISDVIENVDKITITSLNLRVPEGNGTDEIGRLAKTFNKMLERLETSFNMQKDFIANASHELRTPLTAINGQLEVLLMKDRSAGEYKTTISSVLDDIKSLTEISNRLLLLARASAEGPGNYSRNIRVDEILWQTREELMKFNKDYHININLPDSLTDSDNMLVTGDESLLKIAFSNIIDNACKYSADRTVEVKLGTSEKNVEIVFEDHGMGIPQDELQRIFEPFYRAANSKSVAGSGIGLPLVNQIVKNHNGKIRVVSKLNIGTQIYITLPAAF